MAGLALKKGIRQLEKVGGRAGADTVRLWEGYRDQAYLWRAIALLQIPATLLAVVMALVMFFFADTVVEVPAQPQPGHYSIKQLPDAQFIDAALQLTNLISSYQPNTARQQFLTARQLLWEPALSEFEESMLGKELQAIEETSRSQLVFINPSLIRVIRDPQKGQVEVRVPGTRQKLIRNSPTPVDEIVYYITMTTIPRNTHNEFGIVATDIRLRRVGAKTISHEDTKQAQEEKRAARKAQKDRSEPGVAGEVEVAE